MNKSIITDEMDKCYLCWSKPVAIHHVVNGTANRKKSDKYGLIVPLCPRCHERVHTNQYEDLRLKKIAQDKFEEKYSHEKWMEVFGKSYF